MKHSDDTDEKDIFSAQIWSLYHGVFIIEFVIGFLLNGSVIIFYIRRDVKRTLFNYLVASLSASQIAQLIGAASSMMVDIRRIKDYTSISNYTNDNVSSIENSSKYIRMDPSVVTTGGNNSYISTTDNRGDKYKDAIAYIACGIGPGKSLFLAFTATAMGILCIMSITQHIALTRPLHPTNSQTIKLLAKLQWTVGLVCIVPNLMRMKPNADGYNFCDLNTLFSRNFNKMYLLLSVTIFYLIPWTVLLSSYASVIYNFYHKLDTASVTHTVMRKYRGHVVRLMGVWIMIYIVCWTPYAVFMVLMTTGQFDRSPRGEILKLRLNRLTSLPCYAVTTLDVSYYFYSVKISAVVKKVTTKHLSPSIRLSNVAKIRGQTVQKHTSHHDINK